MKFSLFTIYLSVILHRAAAEAKLSADDLVGELKSSLEWSEETMAVVRHVWKEEGPALISMPQETLSVGQVSTELFLSCYDNL